MKILFALVALALLLPIGAVAGERTMQLRIDGMHCSLCAPAIAKALEQVEGVENVNVSVSEKRAVVMADDSVTAEALIAAVAKAGFTASLAEEK
jgi:copper chaperone CopZ